MNRIERSIDGASPVLGTRMRLLKMALRKDVITRFINRHASSRSTAIDIGANRGVSSWALSSKVGPNGRVHAVEPFPANVARLTALACRRCNIIVHPTALSDRSGSATLHIPVYAGSEIDALASLGEQDHSCTTVQVPVQRLDDLLANEIDRVSLVKCDVEGHEDAVLAGGWRLIEKSRPAIVIEIEQRHRGDSITSTFDTLGEAGYDGYFIQGRHVRPLADFDIEQHQLALIPEGFTPYGLPSSYVCDFIFMPHGRPLPTL